MGHLSPIKIHPEITTRFYKKLINDIDYKGIDFSVSKKDFSRIEVKNCICINIFCYEEKLTYSTFYFLNGSLKIQWICYLYQVIMCTSKILTDLCLIK